MTFIKNPVEIVTHKMVAHNLTIDYPVVVAMENLWVQQRINNSIYALVRQLVKEQGYYQDPRTTIDGWYEIKTNQRGILSLTIGIYGFPYQAAHPLTLIKALTFDIETGRCYQLKDLFKADCDYVKVLSPQVEKQIKERDIPLLEEFKGINPNQDYYIADKCLVIFFQLYEITPYVYGFPFFPISVYCIQDIIKENSPLDLMSINY